MPQLAALGYPAEKITYIAFSHYHFDHTANANAFAGSTWLVHAAERDAMFAASAEHIATYSKLRNSKTIILPNTDYDVFGDGSVVIKSAPGHTPGHQVLALRLPKTGPVLIAGDLWHYAAERTASRPPGGEANKEETVASRAAMEAYLKQSGAQLWIEHDPASFHRLKKAPDYINSLDIRVTRRALASSKVGMGLASNLSAALLPSSGSGARVPELECRARCHPARCPEPAPGTPTTTISVDVKVVTLPVTVRDKKGKIVRDLTKDDFELEEDGKPQSIRYFSQETNLPLTVGLLVDTSMSERDNMDRERSASRSFLDQMITRPVDRAFVIHFDREIELLQDLTSDHAKLEKAVGLIDTQQAVESTPNQRSGLRVAPGRGEARAPNSTTPFFSPAMKSPRSRPAARPSWS